MQIFTLILILVILIVLAFAGTWLFFLYQYHQYEQRLHALYRQTAGIIGSLSDKTPLLIELITPPIVRKKEVLSKVLELRQRLTGNSFHIAETKAFLEQIDFLFRVAEKHPEVSLEKRYAIIKNDIGNDLRKFIDIRTEYIRNWKKYRSLRQKSLIALFPGYWWVPVPPQF